MQDTGGFTIIEMLVSITIFVTALLFISGALLSLETASRKARTTRAAIDNVSAAIDSMSRTLRTGTTYHCGAFDLGSIDDLNECRMGTDGSGGDTMIAFERQGGSKLSPNDQYVYRHNSTNMSIERSTDGGTNWVAMTAPEIVISKLRFWVGGNVLGDDQPYVTMIVYGTVGGGDLGTESSFNVQTTISQRTPNLF